MNDHTVLMRPSPRKPAEPSQQRRGLQAVVDVGDGAQPPRSFDASFDIGRDESCGLFIDDGRVSRRHVEILAEGRGWWVRDLGSLNGTFVGGSTIASAPVGGELEIELGEGGPRVRLTLEPDAAARAVPPAGPAGGASSTPEAAPHVAAGDVLFGRYRWLAAGVVALLLAVLVLLVVLVLQLRDGQDAREQAISFFYDIKALELEVAQLGDAVKTRAERDAFERKRADLRTASARYEAYLASNDLLGANLPEEDRLILKVARLFGECELNVPEAFSNEVKRYIKKWQKSQRYAKAMARLDAGGYRSTILGALDEQGLQRHFLYLALQESNFNERAVGPATRFGHAKGMWQFIAPTARTYGLQLGPLKDTARYDPGDERFDFAKATQAAARYLKFIYETDAQASGLLVMASYNWGEHNIIKRIRKMPDNPRERNFWALLGEHKIPAETYDYVFHIFAAAVIGEDPELFGFDFPPPLS